MWGETQALFAWGQSQEGPEGGAHGVPPSPTLISVYGTSTPAWQELWEIDKEREVVARARGALDGGE